MNPVDDVRRDLEALGTLLGEINRKIDDIPPAAGSSSAAQPDPPPDMVRMPQTEAARKLVHMASAMDSDVQYWQARLDESERQVAHWRRVVQRLIRKRTRSPQ